jgi:hypothetical protein
MREVVAKHIIEMAQQGVKDPLRLVEETISFVNVHYVDNRSRNDR